MEEIEAGSTCPPVQLNPLSPTVKTAVGSDQSVTTTSCTHIIDLMNASYRNLPSFHSKAI